MLNGNGVTWEIIVIIPYLQDVVNVKHLTRAFFASIFHFLQSY